MEINDEVFNKVEAKTKVSKESIINIASRLNEGNMKDPKTLSGIIRELSKLTGKEVFYDEVIDTEGLVEKLIDNQSLNEVKVGVICFIFDKNGRVILNRRGPGARDEVGLLQAVGGAVNKSDVNFVEALKREIVEETGSYNVRIGEFIGAYYNKSFDNETKEYVDWIILGYTGYLESGKLENKEKSRSYDFEAFSLDEIKEEELSKSTYEFIKVLKRMK